MARCPFAIWDEISGGSEAFSGGPFKIVHHTTEGTSYGGARAAFAANRSDPHFTVDAKQIYQHVDTGMMARALRNDPGGVQTNRDSAVQIEVVSYAGKPKEARTLENVARLCRWIETTHGVPQVWPNGFPRASTDGRDPGGHNRSGTNWDTLGGHYGHSQVPENVHWDPGYTPGEVLVVTPAAAQAPAPGPSAVRLARGAGGRATTVRVGPRALVCVMFTGRDHVVVRLLEFGKANAVPAELRIDPSQGLVVARDLPGEGSLRRKLQVFALVNAEPAFIRREGKVLVVEARAARRGPRRECARVMIASYATQRPSRRGTCPR
jgi:hypothetical protein